MDDAQRRRFPDLDDGDWDNLEAAFDATRRSSPLDLKAALMALENVRLRLSESLRSRSLDYVQAVRDAYGTPTSASVPNSERRLNDVREGFGSFPELAYIAGAVVGHVSAHYIIAEWGDWLEPLWVLILERLLTWPGNERSDMLTKLFVENDAPDGPCWTALVFVSATYPVDIQMTNPDAFRRTMYANSWLRRLIQPATDRRHRTYMESCTSAVAWYQTQKRSALEFLVAVGDAEMLDVFLPSAQARALAATPTTTMRHLLRAVDTAHSNATAAGRVSPVPSLLTALGKHAPHFWALQPTELEAALVALMVYIHEMLPLRLDPVDNDDQSLRPAINALAVANSHLDYNVLEDWGTTVDVVKTTLGPSYNSDLQASLSRYWDAKLAPRRSVVNAWRRLWARFIGWRVSSWLAEHTDLMRAGLALDQRLAGLARAQCAWAVDRPHGAARREGRTKHLIWPPLRPGKSFSETALYAVGEKFLIEPDSLPLIIEIHHYRTVPFDVLQSASPSSYDARADEKPLVWFPTSHCLVVKHIEFEPALQGHGFAQHVWRLLEQGATRAGAPLDHIVLHYVHRPTYHSIDKRHGWRVVNADEYDPNQPLESYFPAIIRGGRRLNTELVDPTTTYYHLSWSTPAARMLTRLLTLYEDSYFADGVVGLKNVLLMGRPDQWPVVVQLVDEVSAFVSAGKPGTRVWNSGESGLEFTLRLKPITVPSRLPKGADAELAPAAKRQRREQPPGEDEQYPSADVLVQHLRTLGNRDTGSVLDVELDMINLSGVLQVVAWLPWLLVMLGRVWCRALWLRPPSNQRANSKELLLDAALRPRGTRPVSMRLVKDASSGSSYYWWYPRAKPAEYAKDSERGVRFVPLNDPARERCDPAFDNPLLTDSGDALERHELGVPADATALESRLPEGV